MHRPTDRQSRSLLTFWLCVIAIFGATVLILAGGMWIEVFYRLLVEGSVVILWLLAMAGIGAAALRIVRISVDSKALRFATSAALGIGIVSLILLGIGLSGWLNRTIAVGIIAAGLIAFAWTSWTGLKQFSFSRCELQESDWLWLIAVPIAAIVLVSAFVLPGVLWGDEPNGYDVLEYHLQIPREWYELGRIVPLQHNVFSYFPFNVEMHYLLAMYLRGGPWAGMYLAQLTHATMMALAVIAVYGIVEQQTANRTKAIASALLLACIPWTAMLAPVAYNEAGMILFATLSMGWAIHAFQSAQNRTRVMAMALAGAFAGLACGVKLTAVPMVLLAVPICAMLLGRRRTDESDTGGSPVRETLSTGEMPVSRLDRIKAAVAFIIAGVVTFSPWLTRNQVWAGNPVFPEAMSMLGRAHFSEVQVERWKRAHSPTPQQSSVLGRLIAAKDQIVIDWRYGMLSLPIEIAAIILARRNAIARFLALMLLVQFIVWIGFTHLQGRFFVLSIPIAALLIAQVQMPGWNNAMILAAAVSALIACVMLPPRAMQASPTIGMDNFRPLLDATVFKDPRTPQVLEGNDPVILVGEARAFQYDIPMSRLRYRTVFDVDADSFPNLIFAWMNGRPRFEDGVIVDTNELARFQRTYWKIPTVLQFNDGSVWPDLRSAGSVFATKGRANEQYETWRNMQW